MSLRALAKEIGIRSQSTVDNIAKGKTKRSNEATLRLLREWYVRMLREGFEDDRVGEPTEDSKLIAIAYLVQDYPAEEQKDFARHLCENLRDGYARTGAVPKWVRRLKKLIDREWP